MRKWTLEGTSISCKGGASAPLRNAWDASVTLQKGNDALINTKDERICEQANKKPSKQQTPSDFAAKPNGLPQLQPKEDQASHLTVLLKPNCSTLTSSRRGSSLSNFKSQHTKPPFLYEHYPLKPALLYGSATSYVRDPLKRLDQISYLSQNYWHSISATLPPTCQCALVNTQPNSTDNLQNLPQLRLESGAEECSSGETNIADTARQTGNAYKAVGKSVESVCSTCRRDAFFVPPTAQYSMNTAIVVEDEDTTKYLDISTISTDYNNLPPKTSSTFDNQTNLQHQDSILLYQKHYRYQPPNSLGSLESNEHVPLDLVQSTEATEKSSSAQATASTNSLALDYNVSVPIFEMLTTNDAYNCADKLALKHKDSLLFYANLKRKRGKSSAVKTLQIRQGKLLGFVRFSDELNLVRKPSDEDVVFGSSRRLDYKSQGWEESRIAWLAELERRQEVRRRRKRRSEHRKAKQNAAESVWDQCSLFSRRIRCWLAKWNI